VRITSRAEFYNIYTKIVDYTWIGPEVSISGNLHGHINIGSLVDFALGPLSYLVHMNWVIALDALVKKVLLISI
jgi:hypothetical protein